MSAAIAAALPPDDPPATLSKSCGFFVTPKQECSVLPPHANSSKFVFPTITIPSARNRETAVASYGGTKSFNIGEAHVVVTPLVFKISFTATGIPAKTDISSPAANFLSISFASLSADSSVTLTNAFISPSFAEIASRHAFVSSTEENFFPSNPALASLNVNLFNSLILFNCR